MTFIQRVWNEGPRTPHVRTSQHPNFDIEGRFVIGIRQFRYSTKEKQFVFEKDNIKTIKKWDQKWTVLVHQELFGLSRYGRYISGASRLPYKSDHVLFCLQDYFKLRLAPSHERHVSS